ncbi:peroxiredoxin [Telluribacter sp. SYSU D00476]|uniref:peroxiredoxin family protein n=1 Tax=Telluribacter sp. SYSU D00476 TaxID=2811430 RepID=UPI001FF67A0E|nr:TlpA disulfide reductase family protein [Telluribacter sp. SYSU D00476]
MKYSVIIQLIFCGCILGCASNTDEQEDEILQLPITFVEGFGPFAYDYGAVIAEHSPDDPSGAAWVKTYKSIEGIPKQWKNVTKSMVVINWYQLVYQNFHQGNINSSFYKSQQEGWNWTPDEKRLSKEPIRSYVYVISGIDQSGKLSVMIDTNNNCDFSDEKAFHPKIGSSREAMRDLQDSQEIEYDIYQEGRVVTTRMPMVVRYLPHQPKKYQLAYSFPRYASTVIMIGNTQKNLAINLGFSSPSGHEVSELALIDSTKETKEIKLDDGIKVGEYVDLEVNGEKRRFQNLGYDEYYGVLRLKGESLKNVYSTQQGYKFKPFASQEFSSGKPVSMNDYKGKYLYVDFWGTWCKPCVEDIPKLRSLYQKVDKDRVEFLGIVGQDSQERLTNFLKKNPIGWPQLFSDSTNKLVETYNIKGYPSSFLIGPDGAIVDKNLHGEMLEAKFIEMELLK